MTVVGIGMRDHEGAPKQHLADVMTMRDDYASPTTSCSFSTISRTVIALVDGATLPTGDVTASSSPKSLPTPSN
jgi:hypothetical protein